MEKQVDQTKLDSLYAELFKVREAMKKVNRNGKLNNIVNIMSFLDSYESYLLLKISEEKKILTYSSN